MTLPRIYARTIVDFISGETKFFDHEAHGEVRLVFLKSKLMSFDDPNYAVQKSFDEKLIDSGIWTYEMPAPNIMRLTEMLQENNIKLPAYS